MKKGIVFIAALGARNKRESLFNEIISECTDGDYSKVLYINPSAFSQKEARRQFFYHLKTAHKKNTYIPFRPFTIKGLCTDLYITHGKENIVSDRIEPLILSEATGEKNIGYANLLSGLLGKIRHYILDEELALIKEKIKSQIFEEKTVKQAVKAIEILEEYEKRLAINGLVDFGSAVKNSIPLIKEHVSPSTLVIDGFFDPTPLELEVIKALFEKADKVFVLVEENAEFCRFFELYGAAVEKRRLKSFHHREGAGYYSYSSMEDEVEGIAKGVKGLILEHVNPREIIVSFPDLSKYLPMLKRVFRKHGIPVSIAEYNLSRTKPIIALEAMLTSIESDYSRNEFLTFLTSAYFPSIPGIVKEWAVSFSNRAGIVKGKDAWFYIKETLLNSTDEEIPVTMKEVIGEFQRETRKVIKILEKLKDKKNLSSFADELEEVLIRTGFLDGKLVQVADETLSVPYLDEVYGCIENILFELRQFAGIYDSDKTGIDALFYVKHLISGFKGSEWGVNGVKVVPFELAAGLESRAMFFGGMIEGDFPSRPSIDPLLPEKVKKALGLPFLEYYLNRQKRYFKRILNVPSDDPYFSCPAAEGDKVFLPSPFLDWEKSMSPPVFNILTEEEILAGKGAFKQKDFSEVLWDGRIPRDKNVKAVLMKRFGPRVFFRVTDIDRYRQCPQRFYIEKFLRLEREGLPKFEVEARLWGKLAHKTMEFLYEDKDIELKEVDKKLFKGLEQSLKEFPIGGFWSKVAREIFRRLLPVLKEQEASIRKRGFRPYVVEKTLKTVIGSLSLKGKVDRIDLKESRSQGVEGSGKRQKTINNKQQDTVILLDYKTGTVDRNSLQLPLYACIWMKDNVEPVDSVGFYSLKDGQVDWYPKKMDMEEFTQDAFRDAEGLVQKMREGIFTPAPFKNSECRYCYHSYLCKGSS